MTPAVLISAAALILSAVGFFYKLGRDSKSRPPADDSKLDQIYKTMETMNAKLDKISEWQQDAAKIHTSHEERIKTLFSNYASLDTRLTLIDRRLDDREVLNKSLEKILERMS